MLTNGPGQVFIAILAFIVAIGVLVAVHEFGHYWVARRLGIKVLRFSIGFGTPLWRRTLGGSDPVEFAVSAIPLGGYVRMLDEREAPVPEAERARAFNRQPVWKRIAVLLAGPAFNLFFATGAYWVLFLAGIPAFAPTVGEVTPDSIAARAGLETDDRIVRVAGEPVDTREATLLAILDDLIDDGVIRLQVRGTNGEERGLTLDAGANRRDLTQPDALMPGLGFDFWYPRAPALVGRVVAGEPADQAGLRAGDRIVEIDREPVRYFSDVMKVLETRANREVPFKVQRGDATMELSVRVGAHTVDGKTVGRIGVEGGLDAKDREKLAAMRTLQQFGPGAALGEAAAKTWETSVFTVKILGKIVTGDVSLKNISGPISIAEYTGFAARQGWQVFLGMLALISISLGVLNLMPIPILDGGQIVYQLAEWVKGRPMSERAQLLGQQIGIVMLLLLMTLAFYNDISRHLD